jgi:hypothetical protein
MEEHGIADPPLLYNQVVMHDGNVSRCPSKADPSQLEPKSQRFLEGRPLHWERNLHRAIFQVPRARSICRHKNLPSAVTIETL